MIRSLSKKYAVEGKVSSAERDVEKGFANERFKVWEREKIKRAETNKRLLRAATAISTKGKPGGLDQEVLFDVRKPTEEVLANILVPQSSIFTAGRSKEALIKRSYRLRPPIFQRKSLAKPNLRRMELHHRMLGRILKAGIDAQASENMNKLRQYKELLGQNFLLRATLQPAELLNCKLHDAKDTKLDTNSVFSTTTPIVAALSKSRFQLLLGLLAAGFLALGLYAALAIESATIEDVRRFRFTAMELRNGVKAEAPNIESIGLLKAGCKVDLGSHRLVTEGSAMILELDSRVRVEFNGWSFVTRNSSSDPGLDPVTFSFDILHGQDGWQQFGGSSWRYTAVGGRLFLNRFFNTPLERSAIVPWDMRPPWYWVAGRVVPDIIIAVMLAIVTICGYSWELQLGKAIFGNMWIAAGSVWVASAIGEHLDGQTNFSFWWYVSGGCAIAYLSVRFFEAYFIQLMFCLCGLGCIFVAIFEYVIVQWNLVGFVFTLSFGIALNFLALALLLMRIKVIASAARLIEPDEIAYAAAWERVVEKNSDPRAFVEASKGRYFANADYLVKMTREEELLMREGRLMAIKGQGNTARNLMKQRRVGLQRRASQMFPPSTSDASQHLNRPLSPKRSPQRVHPLSASTKNQDSFLKVFASDASDFVEQGHLSPNTLSTDMSSSAALHGSFSMALGAKQRQGIKYGAGGSRVNVKLAFEEAPSPSKWGQSSEAPHFPQSVGNLDGQSAGHGSLRQLAAANSTSVEPEFSTQPSKIRKAPSLQVSGKMLREWKAQKAFESSLGIGRRDSLRKQLTGDNERVSPILALASFCNAIAPVQFDKGVYLKPMQLNRKDINTPRVFDKSKPITSLDQLFAQARALDPILREKVKAWAVQSAGLFPIERSLSHYKISAKEKAEEIPEFVMWSDALLDPILMRRVKWGRVKNPERAIEKALRSYRGNIHEVLDICRKSIYFDNVVDVIKAIKVITSDQDIVLERVKNRLDPDYQADISAGYRDVAMNFRIVNKDTVRMGVEGHVCELQLILIEYAMLKHDSGHARYVNFRNYLGE